MRSRLEMVLLDFWQFCIHFLQVHHLQLDLKLETVIEVVVGRLLLCQLGNLILLWGSD